MKELLASILLASLHADHCPCDKRGCPCGEMLYECDSSCGVEHMDCGCGKKHCPMDVRSKQMTPDRQSSTMLQGMPARFGVMGGILYEQMILSSNPYAYEIEIADVGGSSLATTGIEFMLTPLFNDFEASVGASVELFAMLPMDCWKKSLKFRWISNKASFSRVEDVPSTANDRGSVGYVPPYERLVGRAEISDLGYWNEIDYQYTMDHYRGDLVLSRETFFLEMGSLEPHLGGVVVWNDYEGSLTLGGTFSMPAKMGEMMDAMTPTPKSDMRSYQEFYWGVGPEFGFDAHFYVGDCFNFFIVDSFSLLVGEKYQDLSLQDAAYTLSSSDSDMKTTNRISFEDGGPRIHVVPALLGSLGMEGHYCWGGNSLGMRVALDISAYWHQVSRHQAYVPYFGETYMMSSDSNDKVETIDIGSILLLNAYHNGILGIFGLLVDLSWRV